MTEAGLFWAYRNALGYSAECACGDVIVSKLGTEDEVSKAILLHQESTVHQQWREWQAAVEALKRPTRRRCPCHPEEGAA